MSIVSATRTRSRKIEGPLMSDAMVLQLVERIVGDEFCADMECKLALHPEKLSKIEKEAIEKLTLLYAIVHSAVSIHECHYVHDDWRRQAEELWNKEQLLSRP